MNKRSVVLAVLVGICIGMGFVTFRYAKGFSYLSSDPRACVNCHIMQPQYDSWIKSSHHQVASCVDCHLPTGFFAKYGAKAENGYRHSKAFTLQDFHEPIMITPQNSRLLQNNCIRCHEQMTSFITHLATRSSHQKNDINCVKCHQTVGHGPRVGLGGLDRLETIQVRSN